MRNGLTALVVGAVLLGSVAPAAAVGPAGAGQANAVVPGGGAVADADDGRANATALDAGEAVTGEVTPRNTTDWYAVDLDAGEVLRVVGSDGMGEVHLSIHGPDGEELDARDATANRAAVGAVAETDGTYYVRATTTDGGLGGTYDLTVAVGRDDDAAGDGEADAPETGGGFVEATLVEGEEDWYAVDAEAGDLVTASAVRTDGGQTDVGQGFVLQVVSPDGERVGRVDDAGATHNHRTAGSDLVDESPDAAYQRTVAETDGTYYVRVVAPPEAAGTVEGFVGYELATRSRTPTRLAPNESVDGSLPSALDARAVYALDVNASETLRLTAEPRYNGSFVASVYAPNGSAVANTPVANATTVEAHPGADGRAYVVTRLPSAGSDAGADYTLSVGVPGRPVATDTETAAANDTTAGGPANGTGTEPNGTDDGSATVTAGGSAGDGDTAGNEPGSAAGEGASNVTTTATATGTGTNATAASTGTNTTEAPGTPATANSTERAGESTTARANAAGEGLTVEAAVDGVSGVTGGGFGPLLAAVALLVGSVALLVRQ